MADHRSGSHDDDEGEFFEVTSNDGDAGSSRKGIDSMTFRSPEEEEEVEEVEEIEPQDGSVPEPSKPNNPSNSKGPLGTSDDESKDTLSPAQKEALESLKAEEEAEAAFKRRQEERKRQQQKKDEKKPSPVKEKPNFLVSILRWLYSLVACCNPLLPPAAKRVSRSRSSTREREIPTLSELRDVDDYTYDIFIEVEPILKEHYVKATGGTQDIDQLTLIPIAYKLLRSGGFHYFMKLKVNKGPEYVHAQLFKSGKGQAIVIGDLELKKTLTDEIRQF